MFRNRTILYWFREPNWNSGSNYIKDTFDECSRFIPVFCFDPREEQFFKDSAEFAKFRNGTIERVAQLRNDLQKKGSNLLVVNGSYEVIIPSISRVLHANEVIASAADLPMSAFLSELTDFRNRKAQEIQYNLGMHSISMKVECNSNSKNAGADFYHLPPFPEINPGMIPVKAGLES